MVFTLKGYSFFVRWLYVWIHASKELKTAKQNGAIMHAMIKMAFLPNLFYWFYCYLFVFLLVWSVERKKFSLMFYNLGIKTIFYCFMRLSSRYLWCRIWRLTEFNQPWICKDKLSFSFLKEDHFDKSFLKCFLASFWYLKCYVLLHNVGT